MRWSGYFNPRSRGGSDLPSSAPAVYSYSFQSTLPRRERPTITTKDRFGLVFQSTLPRRERLELACATCRSCNISIHAPAEGATLPASNFLISFGYFNPRSRGGSDSGRRHPAPEKIHISIHAPAEGATQCTCHNGGRCVISIHAPAEGATSGSYFHSSSDEISIHAPAEGAINLTLFTP